MQTINTTRFSRRDRRTLSVARMEGINCPKTLHLNFKRLNSLRQSLEKTKEVSIESTTRANTALSRNHT